VRSDGFFQRAKSGRASFLIATFLIFFVAIFTKAFLVARNNFKIEFCGQLEILKRLSAFCESVRTFPRKTEHKIKWFTTLQHFCIPTTQFGNASTQKEIIAPSYMHTFCCTYRILNRYISSPPPSPSSPQLGPRGRYAVFV